MFWLHKRKNEEIQQLIMNKEKNKSCPLRHLEKVLNLINYKKNHDKEIPF